MFRTASEEPRGYVVTAFAVLLLMIPCSGVSQDGQVTTSRHPVTYDGGAVSWTDYHLELARRHRGKPLGKNALDHLVTKMIVELEAKKRKVTVRAAEIDKRVSVVSKELENQGKGDLVSFLSKRRMTIDEFREVSRLSLLNERLAQVDLGLDPGDRVSASQYALWSKEMQGRYEVVTDPKQLPADAAARIQGQLLTLTTLGREMARHLAPKDRRSILQQMAAYRLLKREARKLAIEVTPGDIKTEVDKRRALFKTDQRFQGIELEDFLHAQGRTLSDLEDGDAFRAQVLVSMIGAKLFPDDKVRAGYEADPALWAGRVGVSRRAFRIFLRTSKRGSAADTKQRCTELATKLKGLKEFQVYAQRRSQDRATASRAGDLGYLHRKQPHYSEQLLSALFSQPIGKVSQPIVEKTGCSLLFVTEVRPAPKGRALLAAIRRYEMAMWLDGLVKANHLRFLTD